MPPSRQLPPKVDATDHTEAVWARLVDARVALGEPKRPVLPFKAFQALIDASPGTTLEQRQTIVRQGRILLAELYPHLPFKMERHGIQHPDIAFGQIEANLATLTETEFHDAMIDVFASMHDAHTVYQSPPPFRGAVAFLPFEISYFQFHKYPRFVVTRVMESPLGDGFAGLGFTEGAEIVEWEGTTIQNHIMGVGGGASAANLDARYARGARLCTLRPLTFSKYPLPYERPGAVITYVPRHQPSDDANMRRIRLPWGFLQGFDHRAGFPKAVFSVSPLNRDLNSYGQYIHYYDEAWQEQEMRATKDLTQISLLPDTFEFQFSAAFRKFDIVDFPAIHLDLPGRKFGYIRIKRFGDGSDDRESTGRLLSEFRRILKMMDDHAPDGLVLDIRGNPGGDVVAAECMLQMLTPGRIQPESFRLANTSAVLSTLRNLRGADRLALSPEQNVRLSKARQRLQQWLDAPDAPALPEERPLLTPGRPISEATDANAIGQVYCGPIALLVDALTYSAADIFAAGFQDHGIGKVVGGNSRTGGGGGTFFPHQDLRDTLGPRPGAPLESLPPGVGMSLAFHRCERVGPNANTPIEDNGVAVDVIAFSTAEDVLKDRRKVILAAYQEVAKQPRRRVDVVRFSRVPGGGVEVELRTEGLDLLRFFLNGRLALEKDAHDFSSGVVAVPPVPGVAFPQSLVVSGLTRPETEGGPVVPRCMRRLVFADAPPVRAVTAVPSVVRSVTQFNPVTGRRR